MSSNYMNKKIWPTSINLIYEQLQFSFRAGLINWSNKSIIKQKLQTFFSSIKLWAKIHFGFGQFQL